MDNHFESVEGPHLGQHPQLVQHILSQYERLRTGVHVPNVIVLRGPSGCGKTRIIREFYHLLQSQQATPYWPTLNQVERSAHKTADPLQSRKVIGPEPGTFIWKKNCLPEFSWWAFNCELMSSIGSHSLIYMGEQQWNVHGVPLTLARETQRTTSETLTHMWSHAFGEIRDAVVDEGSELAVDALMGALDLSVPAAGKLLNWAWGASKQAQDRQHKRTQLRESVDTGTAHIHSLDDASRSFAALIRENATPHLPAIVAVEDVQFTDAHLARLLEELSHPDPQHPVLVVCTTWPESFDQPIYQQLLNNLADRVQVLNVPVLKQADLGALITYQAPNTDPDAAADIARRLETPYGVNVWLSLPPVQRHLRLHNGALELAEDDLDNLPHVLHTVEDARWNQLSDAEQLLLTLAEALNPLPADRLKLFVPTLIIETAKAVDEQLMSELSMAYEALVSKAGWCKEEDGISRFSESALVGVARRHRSSVLMESDLRVALTTAMRLTHRILADEREHISLKPSADNDILARWLYEWHRNITRIDSTWLNVVVYLAERARDRHDIEEALRLLDSVYALADAVPDSARLFFVNVGLLKGQILVDSWRYEEAFEVFTNCTALARSSESISEVDKLLAESRIAQLLAKMGRTDDAVIVQQGIVDELSALLPPDHPTVLHERYVLSSIAPATPENLADRRAAFEAATQANAIDEEKKILSQIELLSAEIRAGVSHNVEHLRALANEYFALPFRVDSSAVAALNEVGMTLMQLGDFAGALGLLKATREQGQRLLGDEDLVTLQVEQNIASCVHHLGAPDKAVPTLQHVAEVRKRTLGPEDPRTLTTLFLLAQAFRDTGDGAQSLQLHALVAQQRQRALGPNHKDSLLSRREVIRLEYLLRVRPDFHELHEVLDAQVRTLGPQHPHVATTRQVIQTLTELHPD